MKQSIEELIKMHYRDVPWDQLMHFNGRANDTGALLHIVETGNSHNKRMSLITLANAIENKGGLTITSPIVLIYLIKFFQQDPENISLYLRIFLKLAKAVGLQWEVFLDTDQFNNKDFGSWIWEDDSIYLWPEFENEQADQLLWAQTPTNLLFDDPWFYTKQILLEYQSNIESTEAKDLIDKGLIYEISTILNMVRDQKRIPFSLDSTWQSEDLLFECIDPKHLKDYFENLTPNVAKYLSFDSMENDKIIKEFIRISQIEQQRGTCLVMAVLDKNTKEFLGSCGIHDINERNAELGLWLKESAQAKGYGSQIVKTLLQICKGHTLSKSVIYCLEKENKASIELCQKFGFTKKYDFIIEPTALKNKLRHMSYFSREI
ncbi:GNAT family N-acetyltransferase [Myroides sp. LJL115]